LVCIFNTPEYRTASIEFNRVIILFGYIFVPLNSKQELDLHKC
jgi:hypothetical protein